MMLPLAFLSPSFGEMVLIAIIALLLYGSDLPQVARSWGKVYQEFRRNLNGIRSELNDVIYAENDSPRKLQYYPEFQHETIDAISDVADEADEPASSLAATGDAVDAADSNAEAVALQDAASRTDGAARHDAHGAA